jgi:hypothetical protein
LIDSESSVKKPSDGKPYIGVIKKIPLAIFEAGEHLLRSIVYIDLNMVRVGVHFEFCKNQS